MKIKFGIKEVVALGIGTALFVVLTTVQIPLVVVPNTALQPRMAILAFFSAVFGPLVGAGIGLVGHALGDAIFYGSVWWSWVFPELIVGAGIGALANSFAVKEGKFTNVKNIVVFNIAQTPSHGSLLPLYLIFLFTASLLIRCLRRVCLHSLETSLLSASSEHFLFSFIPRLLAAHLI